MKSAFYKRNNSYSRSYNATVAEYAERFPLTRAAAHLGISVKAFKKGLEAAEITTNEWHHVGRYANRVDYYDVSYSSEIVNSISFWKGATNRSNKEICDKYRLEALRKAANENLTQKFKFKNKSKDLDSERDLKWYIRKCIIQTIEKRKNEMDNVIDFKWNIKRHDKITLYPDGKIESRTYNINLNHLQIDWENYQLNDFSTTEKLLFNRIN
jgi:hypothetical protein